MEKKSEQPNGCGPGTSRNENENRLMMNFPEYPKHPNELKDSQIRVNYSTYNCFKTAGQGHIFFAIGAFEKFYKHATKTGAEKYSLLIMDTEITCDVLDAEFEEKSRNFLHSIKQYLEHLEIQTELYLEPDSPEFFADMNWSDVYQLSRYSVPDNIIITTDIVLENCGDNHLTDKNCVEFTRKYLAQFKSAQTAHTAKTVVWIIDDIFNYSAIPSQEQNKFQSRYYDCNTETTLESATSNEQTHGTVVSRLVGLSCNENTEIRFISAVNSKGDLSLSLVATALKFIIGQSCNYQYSIVNCSFRQARNAYMEYDELPISFIKQHKLIHETTILLVSPAGNEWMANEDDSSIWPYCREISPPWRLPDLLEIIRTPFATILRICEDITLGHIPRIPTSPCAHCIHVGSHTNEEQMEICDFSNSGCEVDIVSLGSAIHLQNLPDRVSGTSFSTGIVSGALSHLLPLISSVQEQKSQLIPKDVKKLFKDTGEKLRCKWLGKVQQKHKEHEAFLALNFSGALRKLGGVAVAGDFGDSTLCRASTSQDYCSPAIDIGFAAPTIKLVINQLNWKSGTWLVNKVIALSLVAIIVGLLVQYLRTIYNDVNDH